ncbi:pirin family protein [Vitiosangium sp. GDMCC 1.1324]|uniref:pirin family protein n=1 Tax=Vitiosangium sp. (strain GDMCC 1.1324) TaxID=2138576 RepID=UPI00130E717A|nr:pirin family protein [Vitiosangium sp. GDMCC 1.1324]
MTTLLLLTGCPDEPARVEPQPGKTLPTLDLGWISLRDHFVQTVGPSSGRGQPLSDLLVLADATLAPRSSFPLHPHQEMEILTWVSSGTLLHRDSQGREEEVPAGGLQLMSARDGLRHAEGNRRDEPVRLLQIWLSPSQHGGPPLFEVARPPPGATGFTLLAGPTEAPLLLRQDARLWVARLKASERATLSLPKERVGYGVVVGGSARWNGVHMEDGDGLRLSPGPHSVVADGSVDVLFFDLRPSSSTAHR